LLLRLCEKFHSSQRLFIIAGRNEKCKPFFDFFKSFFQRKGKSNRNLKKNSIKREKAKIWLGAYGAVPVVFVQKAGAKRWLLGCFGYKKGRSLGEENGPLSQSAADSVQCGRK